LVPCCLLRRGEEEKEELHHSLKEYIILPNKLTLYVQLVRHQIIILRLILLKYEAFILSFPF
jgi:hypothetical protein